MPSQRRPGLASIHIYVPEDVKEDFTAGIQGESMTDALTRLMRDHAGDRLVTKDWHGLMAILDGIYPEDIFPTRQDNPRRDPGPRIISLLRQVDAIRTGAITARGKQDTDKETP